jgi:ferric-dicitrate binding protein FerR (iron transport regulator)
MSITRLEYLFQRYLDKSCTDEECRELTQLLQQSAHDVKAKEMLDQVWNSLAVENRISTSRADSIFSNILASDTSIHSLPADPANIAPVRRLFPLTRIAVAVAILLFMATGAYFLFFYKSTPEIVKTNDDQPFRNDIRPGKNNAILTLADGHQINLDSAANGVLAEQGTTKIRKNEGQLQYDAAHTTDHSVSWNTVTTARGNQYQLVLPDGSKVWLNAESSIRFPTAFAGEERKVIITGEAYFEVKHNSRMPFLVMANGIEVHDLGTQFNVNAYNNEPVINTTLIEGSVKIVKGLNTSLLKPGQQAQVNNEGNIKLVKDADVEAAMAWKNGQFMFQGNNIQSVMRQLERWYDVEVSYSGNISKEEFVGAISRFENISQVLTMLEKTRTVSFEIKGRNITVK